MPARQYRPFDQHETLGEPPWRPGPDLDAWEAAHGHDARLKCYSEFGCTVIEAQYERRIVLLQRGLARARAEASNNAEPIQAGKAAAGMTPTRGDASRDQRPCPYCNGSGSASVVELPANQLGQKMTPLATAFDEGWGHGWQAKVEGLRGHVDNPYLGSPGSP